MKSDFSSGLTRFLTIIGGLSPLLGAAQHGGGGAQALPKRYKVAPLVLSNLAGKVILSPHITHYSFVDERDKIHTLPTLLIRLPIGTDHVVACGRVDGRLRPSLLLGARAGAPGATPGAPQHVLERLDVLDGRPKDLHLRVPLVRVGARSLLQQFECFVYLPAEREVKKGRARLRCHKLYLMY